jgi:alkylation response protein AidB-like acyl-CoA dehydrogenase
MSGAVAGAFRRYVTEEAGDIPMPGSGRTWDRFEALTSCAATDLSLARLVEGHVDALAVLAEGGVPGRHAGASYGVWAARSRADAMTAQPVPGGWRLTGAKSFCSGSGTLDRALVTAEAPDGYRLFDVSVAEHVVSRDEASWPAVGMADSESETLMFDGPPIVEEDTVGGAGFYTERPGFWFGAAGVAACWYGGAVGLVNHLVATLPPEPGDHVLADLGRAVSRVAAMREVLCNVANSIDSDPHDVDGKARFRALAARQIVHDSALEVLSATAAAGGARPLCHDRAQARRAADLFVYLAQHHGGSDAAELGRITLGGGR